MDYIKHYNSLITKAISRNLKIGTYTEKHHIVPKCLGGTDDNHNIVVLLPEEHFVAHQLLVKMYPKQHKLIYACNMMTINNDNQKRNNKEYKWLKIKRSALISELNKKRVVSKETREKISKANKGKKHSSETKAKISKANKGKNVGEKNGMYNQPGFWKDKQLSDTTRKKLSEAHKGKKLSKEHKNAISIGCRGKNVGPDNHMFGKTHSKETKARMSEMRKGKIRICHRKRNINKTIDPSEFDYYIKHGWVKGVIRKN